MNYVYPTPLIDGALSVSCKESKNDLKLIIIMIILINKEFPTSEIIRPDFLLVDLRDFFSDLGSGGQKKIEKALKMTS